MANDGTKDNNGSQFFLTLAATPELQGKHTMFGRIEGETIYNLMKMADAEMEEGAGGEPSERPLYPTKVMGAEVLVNPFEGMVARVREAPRTRVEEGGAKGTKKRKKPAGKNVLSFGGEEGEDGEPVAPVMKKVKANLKVVTVDLNEAESTTETKKAKAPKEKVTRRRSSTPPPPTHTKPRSNLPAKAPPARASVSPSTSPEPEPSTRTTTSQLDKTNAEIAALKASMKRSSASTSKETTKTTSALEALIPTTSTRGRKRGKAADEKGAIDIFKAFKQRLETLPPANETASTPPPQATAPTNGHAPATGATAEADGEGDEEAALCHLHFIAYCQSCKNWDEDNKPDAEALAEGGGADGGGGEDDPGWMAHSLTFAKDTLGKDLEWRRKMEEIEVIDPREKARTIKEEEKKAGKGKGRVR